MKTKVSKIYGKIKKSENFREEDSWTFSVLYMTNVKFCKVLLMKTKDRISNAFHIGEEFFCHSPSFR